MAKFRLKPFLREISDNSLNSYFNHKQFNFTVPKYENHNERINTINSFFESLPEETRNASEAELSDISDLANEGGITLMSQLIRERNATLLNEFGGAGNYQCMSLWLFIKEPALFREVYEHHYLENLTNKSIKIVRNKIELDQIESKIPELEKYIKAYFLHNEGRGKNCKVDLFIHTDRAVFVAYIEDYIKTDQYFKEGILTTFPRKPSFQIIFFYYPNDLVLEVSSKGGKNRINALANRFNEAILGDKVPLAEDENIYNLDKILEADFDIPVEPEDQIEKIYLKQLRFTNKSMRFNRVTIELDDGEGLADMLKEVKYRNLKPEYYFISKAVFRIKFPGNGNLGSVTMELTYPNKCSLTDKKTHLQAKKYISKWGLENEQPA